MEISSATKSTQVYSINAAKATESIYRGTIEAKIVDWGGRRVHFVQLLAGVGKVSPTVQPEWQSFQFGIWAIKLPKSQKLRKCRFFDQRKYRRVREHYLRRSDQKWTASIKDWRAINQEVFFLRWEKLLSSESEPARLSDEKIQQQHGYHLPKLLGRHHIGGRSNVVLWDFTNWDGSFWTG